MMRWLFRMRKCWNWRYEQSFILRTILGRFIQENPPY